MNKALTIDLKKLNAFLRKHQDIDFRKADLRSAAQSKQYKWPKLEEEKASLIQQLKAYQRMLRIVPEDRDDLAKTLLKRGIHSALQIANTPKKVFIQNHLKLFENDITLAERVYQRAITVRKGVTLQYIARTQQGAPSARMSALRR